MSSRMAKKLRTKPIVVEEVRSVEFDVSQMTFSLGMTLNLGNYESFKIDSSMTLKTNRVYKTKEEKAEAIKRMEEEGWKIVEDAVKPKLSAVKENLKKRDVGR